jgi:hypothetical protein
MNAECCSDGAEWPLIIDKADGGTPLPDLICWECWGCSGLFVDRQDAELCCVAPDAVAGES